MTIREHFTSKRLRKKRRLAIEQLTHRLLMAADTAATESIVDVTNGDVAEFDTYLSRGATANRIAFDANGAIKHTLPVDEAQVIHGIKFDPARVTEVSYTLQVPTGLPVHEMGGRMVGLKLTRLFGADGNLQNEINAFAEENGRVRYELVFYAEANQTADYIVFDATEVNDVRYIVGANTPGERDGFLKVYVNDEVVVDRRDMFWASTEEARIESMWFGGPVNAGGRELPGAVVRVMDNLRVATGDGEAEPEEPETPFGFSVESRGLQNVLKFIGGSERDEVVLQATEDGTVRARHNGIDFVFAGIDAIDVDLGEGDDFLFLRSSIPGFVNGGGGRDFIIAISSDVLLIDGGDGSDFQLLIGEQIATIGDDDEDRIWRWPGPMMF